MEQLVVDQPGGNCLSTWSVSRVPLDVIPGSVTDKRHTVKEGWIMLRNRIMCNLGDPQTIAKLWLCVGSGSQSHELG